ncbi:hypothetical protein [Phyllobacterium leguminum]|uniref:hypothetical protein n=1 Tax=Phyllobacterium leguminum TaxID=314237 RepID=UPI0011B85B14|nr:hypothetical protein [Phyllobacterium leguminum]
MKLRIATAIFVISVILSGCQSSSELDRPDISSKITDPALRAQFKEEYEQRKVAATAMRSRCMQKWSPDNSMIDYCTEQQTPKLAQFIRNKVLYEHLNKKNPRIFKFEVDMYRKCQSAYWGDYEMMDACVENERAVRVLTRVY